MKTTKDLKIPFVWADRRPILLDRLFYIPTHYDLHAEWPALCWTDPAVFGNANPVHIEYCSGNGQWIGERAQENPQLNWVAVEKDFQRARKIWLKIHREALPNLFVVHGDALTFTRYYTPPASVDEIYVNFPDPWPKLRHAKHRLIHPEFLGELLKITRPCAKGIFVTDDAPYASQMIQALSLCPEWTFLFPSPHHKTEWSDYGNSFFGDLWKTKGRMIHYIPFRKNDDKHN
ncbi:MAG: tRNA (guanine(46)-N(7))-methyltransferase TrmB [Chlamydiota bacterium]